MKVVVLRPEVIDIPEGAEIPAGVMSVIPSVSSIPEVEGESLLPDFSVLAAGQYLSREMYHELQEMYPGSGGLYQFQLPELERRFLLGFDENGQPIMGDGIVYFQSYPQNLVPAV